MGNRDEKMEQKDLQRKSKQQIEKNKEEFISIAQFIWESPELGLEERKASQKLIAVLEKYGFAIKKNIAQMPTAFIATYEKGAPVIGFNAEYDALLDYLKNVILG